MASYDDLRNVIEHIGDKTGDPNAWQQGLTPQQIRDVNGWLASDGSGYKGYQGSRNRGGVRGPLPPELVGQPRCAR